jgi:hypothetical protein
MALQNVKDTTHFLHCISTPLQCPPDSHRHSCNLSRYVLHSLSTVPWMNYCITVSKHAIYCTATICTYCNICRCPMVGSSPHMLISAHFYLPRMSPVRQFSVNLALTDCCKGLNLVNANNRNHLNYGPSQILGTRTTCIHYFLKCAIRDRKYKLRPRFQETQLLWCMLSVQS